MPALLRRIALCVMLAWLSACSTTPPLPAREHDYGLPRWLHVVRQHPGQADQDSMLAVQREQGATRWSWFDPLGVPLARQLLDQGNWRSDGLAPPNSEARELFAALLFAWTPHDALDAAYGAGSWREEPMRDGWRRTLIRANAPYFAIRAIHAGPAGVLVIEDSHGTHWRVAPLDTRP
ncbi:DUF3261 domain-containing protein [Pigmentiphaga humi]|nr:DUF3261 domain-containing protein [Pigmentiphaga humi]